MGRARRQNLTRDLTPDWTEACASCARELQMTIFESVGGFRARRIGEQRNARISIGYRIVGTIYIATDAVEDQSAQPAKASHPFLSIEVATLPCNLGK